jgi:hypothetical protein
VAAPKRRPAPATLVHLRHSNFFLGSSAGPPPWGRDRTPRARESHSVCGMLTTPRV